MTKYYGVGIALPWSACERDGRPLAHPTGMPTCYGFMMVFTCKHAAISFAVQGGFGEEVVFEMKAGKAVRRDR